MNHTVYSPCNTSCLFGNFIIYLYTEIWTVFYCYDSRIQFCCEKLRIFLLSLVADDYLVFLLEAICRIIHLLFIICWYNLNIICLLHVSLHFKKKYLISFKSQSKFSTIIFEDLVNKFLVHLVLAIHYFTDFNYVTFIPLPF